MMAVVEVNKVEGQAQDVWYVEYDQDQEHRNFLLLKNIFLKLQLTLLM